MGILANYGVILYSFQKTVYHQLTELGGQAGKIGGKTGDPNHQIGVQIGVFVGSSQLIGIQNVETKLIIPQMQASMKNAIGQVRAEDLVQNRSSVQENIEDTLRESLGQSGIIVVSFAMENLDFEDGFEESIRAKVAAEQQALTMQNKTKEKEELARQKVIEAQAEADSEKIKADAQAYSIAVIQEQLNQSPEYIEYQQVQRWDGKLPQVMSEGVNPFVAVNPAQ